MLIDWVAAAHPRARIKGLQSLHRDHAMSMAMMTLAVTFGTKSAMGWLAVEKSMLNSFNEGMSSFPWK